MSEDDVNPCKTCKWISDAYTPDCTHPESEGKPRKYSSGFYGEADHILYPFWCPLDPKLGICEVCGTTHKDLYLCGRCHKFICSDCIQHKDEYAVTCNPCFTKFKNDVIKELKKLKQERSL